MKEPVTQQEIDAAAALYLAMKQASELAEAELAESKDNLVRLVERYGAAPPRAEKSLRLESERFEVTVSFPQKTSLDQPTVEKLKQACFDAGSPGWFKKMFATDIRYRLQKNVGPAFAKFKAPASVLAKINRLFQASLKIEPQSPSLKVKDKKEKAA